MRERILPNHGDPSVIESGGYRDDFIAAMENYIRGLQRWGTEPGQADLPPRGLIANSLEAGSIHYFAPYEAVHRGNLETVRASGVGGT
jgi:hypothetical protein